MTHPVDEEFTATYNREFQYVWHGLRRLGIPSRDLPDVTHDVFLTVFRIVETYDPSRPFRPWLLGVMFRVASEHKRRPRNHRESLMTESEPDPADPGPEPDEECATREEWRIVDEALQRLTTPLRAVLVMHDFLGHKGHEVADALKLPLKTMFSRLYAARERFVHFATASDFVSRAAKTSADPDKRSG